MGYVWLKRTKLWTTQLHVTNGIQLTTLIKFGYGCTLPPNRNALGYENIILKEKKKESKLPVPLKCGSLRKTIFTGKDVHKVVYMFRQNIIIETVQVSIVI